jgi:hypothetical protein
MDMQLQRMQQEMMLQEQQAYLQQTYQARSHGPLPAANNDADWPLQAGDDNFKVNTDIGHHHTPSQLSMRNSSCINIHSPAGLQLDGG